jgi:hypothetical protein
MPSPLAATTAKKPSLKQRKETVTKERRSALGVILPSLINVLQVDLSFTWVKTTALFDESTLPIGVSKTTFLKAVLQFPYLSVRK